MKPGTSEQEVIEKCNSITSQPLIVLFTENLTIKQAFIKLDSKLLHLSSKSFSYCIDVYFKIFWCFNIEYVSSAVNVLYVLENIYKLNRTIKPCVNDIYQAIIA